MKKTLHQLSLIGLICCTLACNTTKQIQPENKVVAKEIATPKLGEATPYTQKRNQQTAEHPLLQQDADYQDARKNLIAKIEGDKVMNPNGLVASDPTINNFVEGKAPATVNPLLWRQLEIMKSRGLFKITEGVYQFIGYDASIMTLVEGKSGWVILDIGMTPAPPKAGLALANKELGDRPISGIVYSHSHRDHVGGILGLLPEDEEARKKIDIIAPNQFYNKMISEYVVAGPHMFGRSSYQAGGQLKPSPTGRIGVGLQSGFSRGKITMYPPTKELTKNLDTLTIDGVEIIFLDASGTEALAEHVMYLPQYKVIHSAEVVNGTQHNVLTPRGARPRDTRKWSEVIDQMLYLFGEADFMIGSHNWPVYGNDRVRNKLRNNRNIYRFMHDQTMHRANKGMNMHEIANDIPEPEVMKRDFSTRPFYGNYKHNVRAIYEFYFGWWGGNPATLDPYAMEEEAKRFVETVGGADKVMDKAQQYFEQGDYRWAGKLFNYLVFLDPTNKTARLWCASAFEQLGYQEESAVFRNFYLSGAEDLKGNTSRMPFKIKGSNLPLGLFAAELGTRFNRTKFDHAGFVMQFNLTDTDEIISIDVDKDVLFPRMGTMKNSIATVSLTRAQFENLVNGQLEGEKRNDLFPTAESLAAIQALVDAIEVFSTSFNIVEP